ncbi:Glycosyltransferase involved in cell wall bisynthesis [Desulfacinum infernum DSM 9756]|uniref:Glycosyltransferase involved in cell wall bisynthesis n=1 Tax=Desulfacinum infernum DSM 9756 TaxID=1121391 RepID=A0A1M4WXL7_9BACT|nr:glycosyltransferase family 2 protein [Desulfacinum infernum]SHE85986.1 Glycosyltransferase involved in cell wall bisynthesis [Desulfacinum infernum DSM 9756]
MDLERTDFVSVVVPAHNEAEGIVGTLKEIARVLASCGVKWEIIVVDDGSRDGTFDRVRDLAAREGRIKALRFSRNFGKESAILAGLRVARGQAVITMDADLQHPPRLIPLMLEAWREGSRVVDGVKKNRAGDGIAARLRAKAFNAVLSKMGGINIHDSSDFKLLDRVVVDALANQVPERRRFYRGLADWVGYSHASIPFDVEPRAQGVGKWSLLKLIELATTATVSFTSAPLRIVTLLGLLTLVFGFSVGTEALIGWFRGRAVSGFTTTISTLLILGSFIMISLGIIGEYIAKIYDEIKARPYYLVEDSVGFSPGKSEDFVPAQPRNAGAN